jgi:hypothetical protein
MDAMKPRNQGNYTKEVIEMTTKDVKGFAKSEVARTVFAIVVLVGLTAILLA